MRIAQVSPLFESVPPRAYGGTERMVAILTNELSWAGHEVTLFATGDSHVDADVVDCRTEPIGAGLGDSSEAADHIMEFDRVRDRVNDFDIVHFHTRFSHFPLFEDIAARTVTTCHNRVDFPSLDPFFTRFRAFPLVAISDAQRAMRPFANWVKTIHHGYPLDQYAYHGRVAPGDGYLAFLGRICPQKGILEAIDIAIASGRQLKIAARINATDREYYEESVAHRIDGDQIQLVGEIREDEKSDFLNGAAALLFPISWPEPFGLVMIEAMACGTPVIAFSAASVPEVVMEGQTGFVVEDTADAVEAVGRLEELDRGAIRAVFERDFSATRMAERHVELYETLVEKNRKALRKGGIRRVGTDKPRARLLLPGETEQRHLNVPGSEPRPESK